MIPSPSGFAVTNKSPIIVVYEQTNIVSIFCIHSEASLADKNRDNVWAVRSSTRSSSSGSRLGFAISSCKIFLNTYVLSLFVRDEIMNNKGLRLNSQMVNSDCHSRISRQCSLYKSKIITDLPKCWLLEAGSHFRKVASLYNQLSRPFNIILLIPQKSDHISQVSLYTGCYFHTF